MPVKQNQDQEDNNSHSEVDGETERKKEKRTKTGRCVPQEKNVLVSNKKVFIPIKVLHTCVNTCL